MTGAAALPALADVARAIDDVLGVLPEPTTTLRAHDRPVARLGLALEPWDGLQAWMRDGALDALLLHRHWRLDLRAWPASVGLLANHDALDRTLGFARNAALAAALDVALGDDPADTLGERDGFALGTVGHGAPRALGVVRAALHATFGGVEAELMPDDAEDRAVSRIAMARAMTPALVHAAIAARADAYVTGALRVPARAAAMRTGLPVFAVGHVASEHWALGVLADRLRVAWPALVVVRAPDARTVPPPAHA